MTDKYEIIKTLLNKKDFIYCVYPTKEDLSYYYPGKYTYNKNYENISVHLKVHYSLKNTSANLVNIPYTVGNLQFSYNDSAENIINLGKCGTLKSLFSF